MKRIIAILLFSLATAHAASDEEAVKKLVHTYAQGIITLADTGSEKHFEGVVTKALQTKLMLWIKAWQDDNLYMNARIKRIGFNALDINGTSARVVTKEAWNYQYINTKLKKIVLPQTDVDYLIEYSLQKEDENWIIDKVTTLSETQSRPQ